MSEMRSAQKKMEAPHLLLDENLARICINAVQKAFSTLFSVTPMPGAVTLEKDYTAEGDVSGLLGMIQDEVEATLVLSFRTETIAALLGRMYGKTFDGIDKSIRDGVGELTNIIYALTKKDLNDRGHSFTMSIPSVIIGKDHSIFNIHDGKNMVIPFTVDVGGEKSRFSIQIARQNTG